MTAVFNLSPKGLKTVTLSDATDQGSVVGLYCTVSGDVKFTDRAGNVQTIAMTAGQTLALKIALLWSTGTTATVLAFTD